MAGEHPHHRSHPESVLDGLDAVDVIFAIDLEGVNHLLAYMMYDWFMMAVNSEVQVGFLGVWEALVVFHESLSSSGMIFVV